ncbi:MAG: xanthine dehydrogenase family protein molybdopterin-binding subunit [Candidatus Bathyarchaeia archaeon]
MTVDEWWLWKPPEDSKYIGKRGIPRKDAREKASGKAVYCRDISLPGMVYAKHLNSPHANARIKRLDLSTAKELPGLVTIIMWDDPELKDKWPKWAPYDAICPIFLPWLSDRAYFYGQPVGVIVVGESEEACDEALKLISERMEWEELPFNLNWDEYESPMPVWPEYDRFSPLAKGNIELESVKYDFGDVEAGFKEADRVVEFTIRKSEEDVWAGVEASAAVARWQGDYLEVWTNNQDAYGQVRWRLARDLKIPESSIEVYSPFRGAHFGGQSWLIQGSIEVMAALLAKKIGRPVKYLDDYSNFRGAEHHLGTYKFKVGFKNDGTITAVKVDTIYACRGFGRFMLDPVSKLLESTKIPNISLRSIYPLVNRNPTICYKHGAPACTVVTMVINRVAAELGMDPTEVSLKNDGWHGHSMEWILENIAKEQGFEVSRWSLKEVIEIGKRAIGWDEKWHPPGARRLPNGKYHGIGFTAMEQWSHSPGSRVGIPIFTQTPVSAGIRVNSDGTISVYGWRSEGGVASDTTYCQVVADEMGMRYEDVSHRPFIDKGYILFRMGGSTGMISNLIPLVKAARQAKRMILEHATQLIDEFKGKKPEELDIRDSMIFEKANPSNKVPVAKVAALCNINAWADSRLLTPPKETPVMVRQAYFVEVEVDPETGKVDITNVVCVNDVGRAINPDAVNGQQYGGAYMGLGRAFTEAIHYDPLTGVKLNDNLATYDVMLMNDLGVIDCHVVETGLSYGPYGASGCSEAPAAVLSTIAAPAIYNAIGKWIDDWPITPEKILKALSTA